MQELTAIVKSAEEITGVEGCAEFHGITNHLSFSYTYSLNSLAGKRTKISEHTSKSIYDYISDDGFSLKKEWLKDFQEKVDWSKVKVDTPCLMYNNKLYFSHYKDGYVYLFKGGRTSWNNDAEPIEHHKNEVELWKGTINE